MNSHLRALRTCLGGAIAAVALCHVLGLPRGDGPDVAYAAAGFLACGAIARSARDGAKTL